jgi:hypothetical protein
MLHEMGYETGVDLKAVAAVSVSAQALISQSLPGKMFHLLEN